MDISVRSAALPAGNPGPSRQRGSGGRFVWFVVGIAALGELLFGYDTGIISAALLYIGDEFRLGSFGKEIVTSAILIGGNVPEFVDQRAEYLTQPSERNLLVGVDQLADAAGAGAGRIGESSKRECTAKSNSS